MAEASKQSNVKVQAAASRKMNGRRAGQLSAAAARCGVSGTPAVYSMSVVCVCGWMISRYEVNHSAVRNAAHRSMPKRRGEVRRDVTM